MSSQLFTAGITRCGYWNPPPSVKSLRRNGWRYVWLASQTDSQVEWIEYIP